MSLPGVLGSSQIPQPLGLALPTTSAEGWTTSGQRIPASSAHAGHSEPAPVVPIGLEPTENGQVGTYDVSRYAVFWLPKTVQQAWLHNAPPTGSSLLDRAPRQGNYSVIYINGQGSNPAKHMMQACAVAALSGGPVEGIYNKNEYTVAGDLVKSLWLKSTSSTLMNMEAAIAEFFGDEDASEDVVRDHLASRDCAASAALFDLLLEPEYADARIVGHSQGNIVICNAINGVIACRGKEAVKNLRVIAVASPTFFWEVKDIVKIYSVSNDLVGWLSGDLGTTPALARGWATVDRDRSEEITGYDASYLKIWNLLTHSFYLYLGKLWEINNQLFP